jgi:uncharacterized protein (DUF1684 family)
MPIMAVGLARRTRRRHVADMRYPLTASALASLALFVLAACEAEWPAPPPVAMETLIQEHQEWRANREKSLVTPPGGAVLWSGLWPITDGETRFGSDEDLDITLPMEDSPPFAGTLVRDGWTVTLRPENGSGVEVRSEDPDDEGMIVETEVTSPLVLQNDRSGNTTMLSLGSLALRVHSEPGTDRLWLRASDEDSHWIDDFKLPPAYPVSDDWRVTAKYEPFDEPRILRFADVTGGLIEYRAPGELRFRVDGREHSLIATANEGASSFFIIMWDSTATVNTYQAARYLRAPMPDENGFTTIDFNYAYNPPCVFTAFSVCALPPRENRLGLYVTAGEQRPDPPFH